jgi:hypothetical protein
VRHALILIEHDGLSGAIIDHVLSNGDSINLCARLKARGIPYLSYTRLLSGCRCRSGSTVHNEACPHALSHDCPGGVASKHASCRERSNSKAKEQGH